MSRPVPLQSDSHNSPKPLSKGTRVLHVYPSLPRNKRSLSDRPILQTFTILVELFPSFPPLWLPFRLSVRVSSSWCSTVQWRVVDWRHEVWSRLLCKSMTTSVALNSRNMHMGSRRVGLLLHGIMRRYAHVFESKSLRVTGNIVDHNRFATSDSRIVEETLVGSVWRVNSECGTRRSLIQNVYFG